MIYHSPAFILAKQDFLENDYLITVFSKDKGKINLRARGARKLEAKLQYHLDLFNFCLLSFSVKNTALLIGAESFYSFPFFKKRLELLGIGFVLAELIDKAIRGSEKDLAVWQLVKTGFLRLEQIAAKDLPAAKAKLLICFFGCQLLALLGHELELFNCTQCARRIAPDKDIFFSLEQGGLVCSDCQRNLTKVDAELIKGLRFALKDKELLLNIAFPIKQLERFWLFCLDYFSYYLQEPLSSLNLFRLFL